MGQMYLSIMEEYFSVDVSHNLRIALMNNTPPKSFPVDFMHFNIVFLVRYLSIEQIDVRTTMLMSFLLFGYRFSMKSNYIAIINN